MEKQIPFTGILSNRAEDNPGCFFVLSNLFIFLSIPVLDFPHIVYTNNYNVHTCISDFFNWNRVKVRYCDGASFTGDSENKVCELYIFIF